MTANRQQKEQETLRLHSKTFKAWINSHLKKRNLRLETELETDLADGVLLIQLVEQLSGETCTEKYHKAPKSAIQKMENVTMAINFVKKFVQVSVASKPWVEGDLKLMLGVIWRLILQFQVMRNMKPPEEGAKKVTAAQQKTQAKKELLEWVRFQTFGYRGVDVKDFETSFNDGMAFCALVHKFDPSALDYDALDPNNAEGNLNLAFQLAEERLGIPPLLDAEDMVSPDPDSRPDEQCLMTYVSEFPGAFEQMEETIRRRTVAPAAHAPAVAVAVQVDNSARERAAAEEAARMAALKVEQDRIEEEKRRLQAEKDRLAAEAAAREAQWRAEKEKRRLAEEERIRQMQEESARKSAEEQARYQELMRQQEEQARAYAEQQQAMFLQQQQWYAAQQAYLKQQYDEQLRQAEEQRQREAEAAAAAQRETVTVKETLQQQEGNLIGVLKVGVVEARGLMGTKLSGTADPYVRLTLERQQEKTRKVKETVNPKWDAQFQFYVGSPSAILNVTLFDYNTILSDQFLGKVDITVGELRDGVNTERWCTLLPSRPGSKVSGEILLRLLYQTPRTMTGK